MLEGVSLLEQGLHMTYNRHGTDIYLKLSVYDSKCLPDLDVHKLYEPINGDFSHF